MSAYVRTSGIGPSAARRAAVTGAAAGVVLASTAPAYAAAGAASDVWIPLTAAALAAALAGGMAALRSHRRHAAGRIAGIRRETEAAEAARAAARARAEAHAFKSLLGDGAACGVFWSAAEAVPDTYGLAPEARAGWLGAEAVAEWDAALAALRAGNGIRSTALTLADGSRARLEGRAVHGAGLLLVRPLAEAAATGVPALAAADPAPSPPGILLAAEALAPLIDAASAPAWLRHADGSLAYANPAFLAAVGVSSLEEARADGLDLVDGAAPGPDGQIRGRVRTVAAGVRRQFDVTEMAGPFGRAGLAIDATAAATAQTETARIQAAHRDTLDQLSTAVAIFGADERLVFHNAAYERLFDLAPALLAQRPSDSEILDLLRTRRKVPEQANFARWRAELRKAYHSLTPVNDWWHLPGGEMLRVVITPNAEGGVTYLFDDLSEHMALEARYNSLIRIQGETLDGLAEAVAVFGSDGRLNLYNPAFLALWSLTPQALGQKPHIDAVAALCRPLHGETSAFAQIRTVVTALDQREPQTLRLERPDGRVLDGTAQPLPDGGTLVTFRDVTDSVRVARALIERASALEAADKLKDAFVGHVSYHLRTPLNTLMGYADMLREGLAGPLNDRQREFLDHMRASSDQLRALIDDILDLASIDANTMALDLAEVEVREVMDGVAEAMRDQLEAAGVRLVLKGAADAGRFTGDARRVRQILFNLLANAIAVSPEGGIVTLGAERRADALLLTVRDQGPGVPAEVKDTLFERFESRSAGPRHRGVGLGLAIVQSFVALHGGSASVVATGPGTAAGGPTGTLATCIFPLDGTPQSEAAE